VEQTIYAGGAVRAAYRRAQTQAESSSEGLRQTWLEVRYEADVAYWTLSAMQLYVASTEEYVSIVSSLYDVVNERYREGYVAKSDVLQVEARLSEARYALIEIRNDYDVAQHRFYNLLGEEQTSQGGVELGNSILDSMAMPERVGVEELLLRRPDVVRSELSVGIAEQGVKVAKSAFNPRLTASIGSSWQTYSPNVGGRTYLDGALVVGVNVPIFHWRERRYATSSAEAVVRAAEADLSQARRDATLEEADSWSDLTSSRSQIRSSLHNLAIASENLSISTYSYREGQATVLDVLQAQISWIQIYTNAITARFNYAVALSEYMRLTAQ
jgi:outer membrane protein TolC